MLTGIGFTATYIIYFKFINLVGNISENWWFGNSPESIGSIGMLIYFAVAIIVAQFTSAAPKGVQDMVLALHEHGDGING